MIKHPVKPDVDNDEQAQSDGLALASTQAGEGMTPDELLMLLLSAYEDDDSGDDSHEPDGDADDAQPAKRAFANELAPRHVGIEKRVKYIHTRPVGGEAHRSPGTLHGLAVVTAAGYAGHKLSEAHQKALNSKNIRTRIRTRAATQLAAAGGKHALAGTLAHAIDHKRERLQGVGLRGHRNALSASHYLTHHADVVRKVARKHNVSEAAVAHAMSYTAAKNFKRTRIFGQQNSEANRLYHARIGHQAAREVGGW